MLIYLNYILNRLMHYKYSFMVKYSIVNMFEILFIVQITNTLQCNVQILRCASSALVKFCNAWAVLSSANKSALSVVSSLGPESTWFQIFAITVCRLSLPPPCFSVFPIPESCSNFDSKALMWEL